MYFRHCLCDLTTMPNDLVNDNWFPMEVAEVLKYETVVHQEIPGTVEKDSNHPESTRKYQGLSNKLH